ncbi:MAG: hypothetical protein U0105_08825 [Candidatus Obscuribacterales bacterium]
MTLQLLHVSDIHLGSGERHACINPKTGLNVRFKDLRTRFVDYALEHKARCLIFSGDAYKNASPELPCIKKLLHASSSVCLMPAFRLYCWSAINTR